MTILEKIKFEEDWLSEVNLTKENVRIAIDSIKATALDQQPQPCKDCISLNKLDDIITKAIDESENQTECQTLRWVLDVMSELPSVTPKQKVGKWTCTDDMDEWYGKLFRCSVCGAKVLEVDRYCPYCGSDNGGGR